MVITIEVRDRGPEGALQFDLGDILTVLKDQVQDLDWFILELEAVGDVPGLDLGALPGRLRRAPNGLQFSWAQLVELGEQLDQVIDCEIVGCDKGEPRPIRSATGASDCTLVIEAVDSTFWRVTSKLPRVAEALRSHFRDVIEI